MITLPFTSLKVGSSHEREQDGSFSKSEVFIARPVGIHEPLTRTSHPRAFSYNWSMEDLVINSTVVSGVTPIFFIEGSVIINSSTKLTIEPNSTILMGDSVSLDIKGALVADASDIDCHCPIKFRPLNQSAGMGAWDSIVINSTSSDIDTVISNIEISNASVGIRCIGSSPTITDCMISYCSTRGIECSSASAPMILRNTFNSNSYGIFIDSGSSPTITNNRVENSPNVGILSHSSTTSISSNTLEDNFNGISVYSASCAIEGNTISGGGRGLFLYRSQSVITGNHIDNSSITGVDIRAESNALLQDNIVTHSTGYGIKANASALTISDCTVSNTNAGFGAMEYGNGITVNECYFTEVINCTLINNKGDGAEFRDSEAVTVSGNSIMFNSKGGIDSFNCSLSLRTNTISSNGEDVDWDYSGVYLWRSILIGYENTVSNNAYAGFEAYHSDLTLSDSTLIGNYKGFESINCQLQLSDIVVMNTHEEGLNVQDGSDLSIEACSFKECGEDGIVVLNGSTASVRDCEFVLCNWSALDVFSSSVDVENCTIKDCGGIENYSGIYAGNSTLNVTACSISNNSGSGFLLSGVVASLINITLEPSDHRLMNAWSGSEVTLVNSIYNISQVFLDETSRLSKMVHLWVELLDMVGSPGQGALVTLDVGPNKLTDITDAKGQAGPFYLEELSKVGNSTEADTIFLQISAHGFAEHNTTIFSITGPVIHVTVNRIPELVIVTPSDGENVTGTVIITGVASDPDGEIEGLSIITGNGTSDVDEILGWIDIDVKRNWTYTWDTTRVVNGEAFIAVRAFDGRSFGATSITIMVDNEGGWDSDDDGLSDLWEEQIGTDPDNPDTDGDGLKDGLEVDGTDGSTTDPLEPDSDDDGLLDGEEDKNGNGAVEGDDNRNKIWDDEEVWLETDPNNPDTDGDGVLDGDDPDPLDPDVGPHTEPDEEGFFEKYFVFILLPLVIIILLVFMVIIKSRSSSKPDEEGKKESPLLKKRGKVGAGKGKKGKRHGP